MNFGGSYCSIVLHTRGFCFDRYKKTIVCLLYHFSTITQKKDQGSKKHLGDIHHPTILAKTVSGIGNLL
ncbi:MAG: hypothetical protein NZL83_02060 [Candidatus Absconditabacterales bacterium]|nr:hypothetical protein [Candidatus Absconditabacterales bacterium]